ncbi:hypothetical protein IFM47457_11032 [Aspergillus lentulus]|nr:hypothetical protein IFM47457_11032 [Aspergillus lentulus]
MAEARQMLPTAAKVQRSGGLPRDFLDEGNAQKDEVLPFMIMATKSDSPSSGSSDFNLPQHQRERPLTHARSRPDRGRCPVQAGGPQHPCCPAAVRKIHDN